MKNKSIAALTCLLAVSLPVAVQAQAVYRCELADGSITFSDLPCRSDVGRESLVDATPHQGHRSAARDGSSAYDASAPTDDDRGSHPSGSRSTDRLSRNERLALERERKELLSGLKRRHVDRDRRKAMIDELRRVDGQLGIGPEDVADMPFHNREVYEEYPVFRD